MLLLSVASATARADQANELLDLAAQATEWSTHAAAFLDVDVKRQHMKADGDYALQQHFRLALQWYRDGQRLRYRMSHSEQQKDGKWQARISADRLLLPELHVSYVQGARAQLARTPEEVAKWRDAELYEYKFGTALDGRIWAGDAGSQDVINLARSGLPVVRGRERIQDIECIMIEAPQTPAGAVKVWIAPD